jgi:phospho-N-acetylmuramoyl-pentapeptide-transferase
LVFIKLLINFLKNRRIGKHIRKEGPKEHYKKEGTPVMGGVAFLLVLIPFLFFKETFFFAFSTIFMGILGLIDDILLLINKDYGLRPLRKILLTFVFAFIIYLLWNPKDLRLFWGNSYYGLGYFYIPFFLILFVFLPNAVNLTDGLDGLAGGTSFISLLFLLIFQILKGNFLLSLSVACFLASILGFLWYNIHPAEIFMGDVGAFSLGNAIAALLVLNKMESIFLFISGIFLLESLSVFVQIFFYKWKGKRVFKMSPLHHHFELNGWKETKIVGRFYIIHLIMILGGYLLWLYP